MSQADDQSDNRLHTADTRNPDWDKYSPDGRGRTDEQIRADVHEVLRGGGQTAPEGVSISVGDGIVTLSGRVSDSSERQRLTELVRSVASVKDVKDQLTS
jgi:osmotically-inducible protein OsmY